MGGGARKLVKPLQIMREMESNNGKAKELPDIPKTTATSGAGAGHPSEEETFRESPLHFQWTRVAHSTHKVNQLQKR